MDDAIKFADMTRAEQYDYEMKTLGRSMLPQPAASTEFGQMTGAEQAAFERQHGVRRSWADVRRRNGGRS